MPINKLDSKPIRNPLAGSKYKGVKGNKLAGHGKLGGDARVQGNKLAFPTTRLGLVYRSLEDGANLIEGSSKLIRMIETEVDPE